MLYGGAGIRRCAGSHSSNLSLYKMSTTPPPPEEGGNSSALLCSIAVPGASPPPAVSSSSCSPPFSTAPRKPQKPFERTWAEDVVRVVCISDTHSRHDQLLDQEGFLPQGDVLVHAGDFSQTGTKPQVENFRDFLKCVPHPHKVITAGNHDITLHEEYYMETGENRFHKGRRDGPFFPAELRRMLAGKDAYDAGFRYLENSETEVRGIRFWGTPWSPEYNDWAFGYEEEGDFCRQLWSSVPEDLDVFITHGPPRGVGDLTYRGKRAGCPVLLSEVQSRIRPRIHIFGHIHEGYGVYQDDEGILYVNASTSTLQYRPTQAPIVFDVPLDRFRPIEFVSPVDIQPIGGVGGAGALAGGVGLNFDSGSSSGEECCGCEEPVSESG